MHTYSSVIVMFTPYKGARDNSGIMSIFFFLFSFLFVVGVTSVCMLGAQCTMKDVVRLLFVLAKYKGFYKLELDHKRGAYHG